LSCALPRTNGPGATWFALSCLALWAGVATSPAKAQDAPAAMANEFNDPFLQVTRAIAECPPEARPLVTPAEHREQAHWRAERGTSCFRSGRCRLPNAYLYDAEIIPRVQKAILADGRFDDTSVWVEGQRRWVWLRGCVRDPAQSVALEQLVRSLDDVEAVINVLKPLAP